MNEVLDERKMAERERRLLEKEVPPYAMSGTGLEVDPGMSA